MDNLLELIVKATTAAFDKAIDQSQTRTQDFVVTATEGFEQVANKSRESFQIARETLERYDAAIAANIELQKKMLAEGKDVTALREEQAKLLKSYDATAASVTRKRIEEIQSEATVQKTSVAEQIAALKELRAAVAGSATNIAKVDLALGGLGGEASMFGTIKKAGVDIENSAFSAGMALNALGLKSAATAARASALFKVFRNLGSALPTILTVGVGFTALYGLFGVLRDSAKAAAVYDQHLATLGATITDQGGDWNALRKQVAAWADEQERSTIYSRDQAVQALTRLTATGMHYADAMAVTRVAEDASAATGQKLTAVTHALMEAMHGRTQALTLLGIGTKASIHDGMSFNQVLAAIEQHMGGSAAAAADTYAGKMTRLQNVLQSFDEDLGSKLTGSLGGVIDGLTRLAEAADANVDRFAKAGARVGKFFEAFAKSGPVIVAVTGALTVAMVRLTTAIVTGLVRAFVGLLQQIATYIVETSVDAVVATVTLAKSIGVSLVGAVQKMATMFAVEGIGAIRTFVLSLIADAIPTIGTLIGTILAILGPITLVVGAIAGLAFAWSHNLGNIQGVTDTIVTWIVNRFGDLLRILSKAVGFLGGLAEHLGLGGVGKALDSAASGMDRFGRSAHNAHIHVAGLVKDAQNLIGHAFGSLFGGHVATPKNPADVSTGINAMVGGGTPGHAAAKAESNRISAAKDRIAGALALFDERISQHKDYLEQLDVRESRIKTGIGEGGATRSQTNALQAVDTERHRTNMGLASAYIAKVHAERAAIAQLAAERQRIARDPAMVKQYAQLDAAIRQHLKAIATEKLDSERAQVAASKALTDRAHLELEYHKRVMAQIKAEQNARLAALQDRITGEADQRSIAATREGRGYSSIDKLRDQQDTAAGNLAVARAREADAKALLAHARGAQEVAQADRALAAAHRQVEQTDTALQKAQIRLQQAIDQTDRNFTEKLGAALGNGVQEIKTYTQAVTSGQRAMAGWAGVIMDIVERTRSFKLLMQMLTNIFQMLARILDAVFLPAIKTLNTVLTDIVNVFVALYNAIATLVSLLGIHIERLQYINSLLGDFGADSRPLLDVVHDLPTLTQFGAGSWGALQPDQFGKGNPLYNAVITQTNDQAGWFGRLIELGAAFLAIDWLTHGKWFAEIGSFFGKLGGDLSGKLGGLAEIVGGIGLLDSHTQGVLGVLEKILGVLLLVQGIMQALGGAGFLGGLGGGSSLFGLVSGAGSGSSFGGLSGLGSAPGLFSPKLGSPTNGGMLTFLNNPIGNGLGGAAAGALIGDLIAKATGGNSTWGSVGGALGGGLASGLGLDAVLGVTGPIGMLVGALAGGALGSLFGPHYNAQNNPDMYESQTHYGQIAADLTGVSSLNSAVDWEGAGIGMDQQTSQITGGQGIIPIIAKYIQQTGGTGLTQQQIQMFSGLTNGSNAISRIHQGTWYMGNGQSGNWLDIANLANQAFQTIINMAQGQQVQTAQQATASTSQATSILNEIMPALSQLDPAAQQFVASLLGLQSAVESTTQSVTDVTTGNPRTVMPRRAPHNALAMPTSLAATTGALGAAITQSFVPTLQAVTNSLSRLTSSPNALLGNGGALTSSLANALAQLPAFRGTIGTNAGTSINITQNNATTAHGIEEIDRVNASLGRQLTALVRTQRYAF